MMLDMPDHQLEVSPLFWLKGVLRLLNGLTILCTVAAVVIYVGQQLFSDYYRPVLGHVLVTACVMLACGGICAFFFMGLVKLVDLWAELTNSGHHKTILLEALIIEPDHSIDQAIEQKGG
jgi:hypothetical protein